MTKYTERPPFTKLENETWRDVVARIGAWANVQQEVLDEYDFLSSNMVDLEEAAWMALYEWDA